MRRKFCLLFIILVFVSWQSFGQKIVMRIPGVTDKNEEIKTLSLDITAATSWTKGGGASVGKPNPGSLEIRKVNARSTSELMKNITMGKAFSEITFEYQDESGKAYYTITLTGAFPTQLAWVNPDCSDCLPKLEHRIAFVFQTIKVSDALNGTTVTWDVPAGKVH